MNKIQCKNCGFEFHGDYCNQCGQSAVIGRLHKGFILRDLHIGLFNLNSGFFFTVKELWLRPGKVVKNFVEGKRVRYYYPISMLVVLATVYSFLFHYFNLDIFHISEADSYPVFSLFDTYYVYISLVMIPLYSIVSCVVFYKWKYNFYEHIVLNTYSACQRLVLSIFIVPIMVYKIGYLRLIINYTFIADLILMIWCYIQFFYKGKWLNVMLLSVAVWVIILILFVLTILIIINYV